MPNPTTPQNEPEAFPHLNRRAFLGGSLAGLAVTSRSAAEAATSLTSPASATPSSPPAPVPPKVGKESTYWDRTDTFEEKVRLLETAWKRKDHRLARALAHSLRQTALQAQAEEQDPGTPLSDAGHAMPVADLPPAWREWANGWSHCKVIAVEETAGLEHAPEPVEFLLAVPLGQVTSLAREIRVARVSDGALVEVPSQVFHELRRGVERLCRVLILTGSQPRERQMFLVFYGNPDAELPGYVTDLSTSGEGFALDIENAHFKASLSRQMGQLERLTLKREHSLELFSGGQGHGEPPGIDWAHDYVASGNFQKMRISLWDACPDYEVIRGPLCTIIRRWGFPYSPVHPVFTPSRLNIDIEYRFYAGLPWFHKTGAMTAVKDFDVETLRDDEWVFSGHSFTDRLWMGADGKLKTGEVDTASQENLWAAGFYNAQSQDAFIALFLEHHADGLPGVRHSGAPTLSYRWHGQLWSRAPLGATHLPAGATLHEKNAYVTSPFTLAEGPRRIEVLRDCLLAPLAPRAAELGKGIRAARSTGRLARPGEAGDGPIPKASIWAALHDCKDAQLYTADIDVVDLGLIRDVRVRGGNLHIVMAMPHRGRPLAGYFVHGSISVHPTVSVPIRERLMRLPGVTSVSVEQVWDPAWNSNDLTEPGRKKLGV